MGVFQKSVKEKKKIYRFYKFTKGPNILWNSAIGKYDRASTRLIVVSRKIENYEKL
jgi:hypothetical protein